jgi:hypothetical protein
VSVQAHSQSATQSPLYSSGTYHTFSLGQKHLFKTYAEISSMFTVTFSPQNDLHDFHYAGLTLYTPNNPRLSIENGNMYFESLDWSVPSTYSITA